MKNLSHMSMRFALLPLLLQLSLVNGQVKAQAQLPTVNGELVPRPDRPGQPQNLSGQETSEDLDRLHGTRLHPHTIPETCDLGDWVVYGFHPHWVGSAWKSYNFKLLSHISYFGYILDPETGGYKTVYDWKTTAMVDSAKAAGCRVDLCITSVSAKVPTRTMLNNPVAVDTCINTLVRLVHERNADGVTIDFEDLHSRDSAAFTSFVAKLGVALRAMNPDATISVAGYALGGEKKFNLPALDHLIDYLVVMAYDYSYAGSKTAGAVAPMPGGSRHINLQSSIDSYVKHGFSPRKLVMALPYYGYEWKVKSSAVQTNDALGHGKAVIFRKMKALTSSGYERKWDTLAGNTSFFEKKEGDDFYQAWVPDSAAMALKLQLIKDNGIAGTGMWALGYDNGYHDLWNLLHEKFSVCKEPSSTADGQVSEPKDSTANSPDSSVIKGEESSEPGFGWLGWAALGLVLGAILLVLLLRGKRKGD